MATSGPPTSGRTAPDGVSAAPAARPRGAGAALALAVVLGAALVLRAPGIAMPFERDEGEYAYVAQHWLAGEAPYASAFFQKPPGIAAAYALAFAIGGEDVAAPRWAAAVAALGTLLLTFFVVRRLASERAALAASAFGALLCADPAFGGNAANTELFMLLPLTASLLAALRASDGRSAAGWSFAAGALGGAALLFKQPAAPNVLLAALIASAGAGRGGMLRRAAAFGAGACTAIAPAVLYFAWAGALREMWDCVFGYNLAYASALALSEYPKAIAISLPRSLRPFGAIYALAAVGAAAAALRAARAGGGAGERSGAWLLLAWFAASLIGVAAGGYFREHYYLQAAPPLAALAGAGAADVLAPALARRRRGGALAAIVACVVGIGVAVSLAYYLADSPEARSRAVYFENPFAESAAVARLVAQRTQPGESVFVFGSEPQILFLSGRRSASRYMYVYPLMLPTGDAQRRQREALAEIERARPAAIVTVTAGTSFLRSPQTPYDLFLGLQQLLRREYRLVARVPADSRERLDAVSAAEAERAWAADPGLGRPEVWGTLAVWERVRAGAESQDRRP